VETPDLAYLIRREPFDHFLVKKAVSAGVVLQDACTVTSIKNEAQQVNVYTNKGNFSARFLVGADGVNSIIARQCNLLSDRLTGMALEAEFEVPEPILERQGPYATFDFGSLPHGYGWIFPKSNRISIGILYASPKKRNDLRKDFERFVSLHPQIEAFGVNNLRAHPIPLGGQNGSRQSGRVLLVGDAANLADPWMGEGLYYAITSAEIAAEVLSICLTSDSDNLIQYDRIIKSTIIKQFEYAKFFADSVYRFPRINSILLSKSTTMQKLVFGNLFGTYSFKQLSWQLLLKLPLIIYETMA
jgi:geranylgeranyl reductase family protein